MIETRAFGRTLVMDDKTQSAESDEKVYHESLVHPAMLAHGNPKTVRNSERTTWPSLMVRCSLEVEGSLQPRERCTS